MFQLYDLYLLSPELSLTLLAFVVMMVDLFVKRRVVTVAVALVGLIIPLAFSISLAVMIANNTLVKNHAFFNMLVVDSYAVFFQIVFLIIVTGMMLMAGTGELISIYISLELTSIPLYVMAGLIRGSERSAEASVKYVLLGAMSSAILLYGFALLYGLTGTTDLKGIATAIASSVQTGNLIVLVAAVLILAGFGFKISAVPFHMWAPDIYEGAPTPSTAFFSVGSKAAGFAAL